MEEEKLLGCFFRLKGEKAKVLKRIEENRRVLIENAYALEQVMELEANEDRVLLKISIKDLEHIMTAIDETQVKIMDGYKELSELGLLLFKDTATE